jgi:hypothetical protein
VFSDFLADLDEGGSLEGVILNLYLTQHKDQISAVAAPAKVLDAGVEMSTFKTLAPTLSTLSESDKINIASAIQAASPIRPNHRLLILRLALIVAVFLGVGGGFAIGRKYQPGFESMDICMSAEASYYDSEAHPELTFVCWYWYYLAPLVYMAGCGTILGFIVYIAVVYMRQIGALASDAAPELLAGVDKGVLDSEKAVISGAAILRHLKGTSRPDFGSLLDQISKSEQRGSVPVMVAGPERMVLQVEDVVLARQRSFHFVRESWKV